MNKKCSAAYVALILMGVSLFIVAGQAVAGSQLVRDVYPRLSSGALASAKLANLPAGVLLRSKGLTLTQKSIDAEIAKAPQDLQPQLRKNAFFVLENLMTSDLLLAEAEAWAKKNNRDPNKEGDALLKDYFQSLTPKIAVTDDELRKFFDENKDMMGGATFDQVKGQLKNYVLDQKRLEAMDAHMSSIGDKVSIEINKSWAAKQYVLTMNNPVDKARRSGKPTLADFGADGCRPCEMMAPILDSLKKEYAGKANVLFIHVRKEQILAARYGIRSIPVQIFFDKSGKEVFKHVGFFPKKQITAKFAEMGAK